MGFRVLVDRWFRVEGQVTARSPLHLRLLSFVSATEILDPLAHTLQGGEDQTCIAKYPNVKRVSGFGWRVAAGAGKTHRGLCGLLRRGRCSTP